MTILLIPKMVIFLYNLYIFVWIQQLYLNKYIFLPVDMSKTCCCFFGKKM